MPENRYAGIFDIGSIPISKNNPAGDPVVYDSDYDLVDTQIKKLGSLTGEAVDWNLIVEKGSLVLKEKSKDMSVAAWLCLALFKVSKLEGLLVGINIFYDLSDRYWESLYPKLKRLRGRVNLIAWLFENLDKTFSSYSWNRKDHDGLTRLEEAVIKLTRLLGEKLGDKSPEFSFREFERNLSREIRETEEKRTAATEKKTPAVSSALSPSQTGKIENSGDAEKALKEAFGPVRKAAAFLRNQREDNPLYYRLVRVAVWSGILNMPPHTGRVTIIPEIRADVVTSLKVLEEKGNWKELLKSAEDQFPHSPLWFDLQRYAATAAANLGGPFQKVGEAISQEFRSFLDRFPEIIGLKFAGGKPLADERTEFWLEDLGKAAPAAPSEDRGIREEEGNRREDTHKKVRELLAKKNYQEAIDCWNDGAPPDGSGRERFAAKLQLAELFVKAGRFQEAFFQLELLDEEIRSLNLEMWDRRLSARVIQLLIRFLESAARSKSPGGAEKLNGLKRRLYKLDLAAALSLDT